MSTNLNLSQLAENQANPEVTVNTATGEIDAAITETFAADLSGGNVSLTNGQYRQATRILASGVATSGRTLTVPAIKRMVLVKSDAANTDNITLTRGSTTYALKPGENVAIYTDGTSNGMDVLLLPQTGRAPMLVSIFIAGMPVDDATLWRYTALEPFTLPEDLAGSEVDSEVAADDESEFTILKNGSPVATITFAAAATTATFVAAADVSFAIGDIITLAAPTPQDATLANINFSLYFRR